MGRGRSMSAIFSRRSPHWGSQDGRKAVGASNSTVETLENRCAINRNSPSGFGQTVGSCRRLKSTAYVQPVGQRPFQQAPSRRLGRRYRLHRLQRRRGARLQRSTVLLAGELAGRGGAPTPEYGRDELLVDAGLLAAAAHRVALRQQVRRQLVQ